MGDLSKHFSKPEFACHCGCGADQVSRELIDLLELLREACGNKPVKIISGTRCIKHNKSVGGAMRSQHLLGNAADIRVRGHSPKEIHEMLDKTFPKTHGIGLYPNWVHIDIRKTKSRWVE